MTCSGSPSCNRKVVRSGSCRWRMVSSALRSDSASRGPRQPHREGHVVGDQLTFELFQQPQSLLGEGERDRPPVVPRDPREPSPRAVADCGALDADLGGQCRDGRRLEQPAQGEVDIQHGVRPGDDLGGQQRMPAQLEEVVVDADAFQAQDFCPDRRQLLLDRVSRRRRNRWRGRAGPDRARATPGDRPCRWAVSGSASSTTKADGTM